jgi:hypothetical protein
MKQLVTLFAILALSSMSIAQNRWNFAGYFPDSTQARKGSGVHGLAVDPDGKIWAQWFGRTDSVALPGGGFAGTLGIYVFNPNGTQAAFSPIKILTGPGVNDTLFTTGAAAVTNRGLRRDINGHILVSIFDRLYRVNYQTGVVMNKATPGAGNAITAVGVDTLGEIFVQTVLPGFPIRILAPNFSSLGNVTDTSRGFCRAGEASKNGNDVYSLNYTNHCVLRYHSDFGSFGPYTVGPNDTLLRGFDSESVSWNPARTRLWFSSGSVNDRPNRYPGATTNYTLNTWYATNPAANFAITDSIKWAWNTYLDSINIRPRAIAFSNDGLTAYVGCFGTGAAPTLQKFTFGPSSVEQELGVIPVSFTLAQNYPNPFNPSTEIKFTLTKSGFATLRVYNMLGQEVATLANEELSAGAYKATFTASDLPSGTYIYRLTSNGKSISKKMMLVK